MTFVRLGHHKG